MKYVLEPIAKSVLTLLGLTVAAAALNMAIQKKFLESGMRTLRISNKEMANIMKILKCLNS